MAGMKVVHIAMDQREVFSHYDKDTPEFHTAIQGLLQGFAMVGGEVEIHVIGCTQRPVKSPSKLAANIFFHSLVVPKIGWLRTGYQGCIRAVRRKVREINPDLVHGQGTERECAISAIFSGYPNVLTVHGNMRLIAQLQRPRPFSYLWLTAKLEAFTIPRTSGVICITSYTREAVNSLAAKTWDVPNAVDAAFFDIQPKPSGKRTILCVASVDERKNQNALIRALDPVQLPENFELLFLGFAGLNTPYQSEFFKLVEGRPWCRYGGVADRETLKSYFSTAAGLVLPSLEDNCPMVVLEAMAAGIPVAAASVGGVPELIRDGQTGLLFDPLDGKAMGKAMEQLFMSSALAGPARAEALKRFHPLVIARRHVEIYREVLGR
jgi:glycosyltransferase involved in cell wall biosynthesis